MTKSHITAYKDKQIAALQENEAKFRLFFSFMNQGAVVLKLQYHKGILEDAIIIDANHSFVQMVKGTELDLVGHSLLKFFSGLDNYWLDGLGKVDINGESTVLEGYVTNLESYFKLEAYPYQAGQLAILVTDVSGTKDLEVRLNTLSYKDKLTGLYNRAFFEEELKRLDEEENLPLSIIVGDANGMKLANDAFGHHEGDQLLKKLARVMRRSCRETDILARWGGDEFAIILPKTSCNEAKNILATIKEACANEEATPLELSIALGCATRESNLQEVEEIIKKAEGEMYSQKLSEATDFRNSIIASLIRTLGEKDYETEEHAWRMQSLAIQLGSCIELTDEQLNDLVMAVTLHDIGKIAVPEEILTKPGRLTGDERKIINEHSERGYRITLSSDELSRIAPIVLSHHERWDGEGYPQGLKGKEIPLLARIISIVDTYDVMTNGRPYRAAVSTTDALAELRRCSGSQFDPALVENFLTLF